MNAPLATVAMVTYNSARFVAGAIESVLAQTFADFELVICDDASSDDTWAIVQRYTDPRIRALRHSANLGEYRNRNHALALARGEYLMYIDGDDHLYRHGLEFMVRMLSAYPRAAFAAALPWREQFIFPVALEPAEYFAAQFLGPRVMGRDFTQILFRTAALRAAGGFDLRYRTGDTHIQLLLGMRHPVLLTSDGIAWWRRSPGQASDEVLTGHRGFAELTRYSLELLRHPDCPLSPADREIAIANTCGGAIRTALRMARSGRLARAWKLLGESGLVAADMRHAMKRPRRPFLAERGGANPLRA